MTSLAKLNRLKEAARNENSAWDIGVYWDKIDLHVHVYDGQFTQNWTTRRRTPVPTRIIYICIDYYWFCNRCKQLQIKRLTIMCFCLSPKRKRICFNRLIKNLLQVFVCAILCTCTIYSLFSSIYCYFLCLRLRDNSEHLHVCSPFLIGNFINFVKKTTMFTEWCRHAHSYWQSTVNAFLYVLGKSNSMLTWTYIIVLDI